MQEQDKQRGVYIPEYEEEDKALAKEWAQALPDAEHRLCPQRFGHKSEYPVLNNAN